MNNIKKYRALAGITQTDFAKQLGISRTGLGLIENGKVWIINKKTLTNICSILGVTQTQVLGLENLKYIPDNDKDIDYMIELLQGLKKEN